MVMTINEERISNMTSEDGNMTSEDGISNKFMMIIIVVFMVVSAALIIKGIENKSNSITESMKSAPSQLQVDFMDKYGITGIEDSPIVALVVDGEVTIWDDNGAKLRPVTIDEDNKS